MKILVPIDETEFSEHALPKALELGRGERDFELVLVSVGELPEVSQHAKETHSVLEKRLRKVRERLDPGLHVQEEVRLAGDPVRGILEVARDEHVDRIVIASHEHSAFRDLIDGSVAEELQEETQRIPVTVV